MSFQVGIGSLGGTVFFQVGLCTPLRTMYSYIHFSDILFAKKMEWKIVDDALFPLKVFEVHEIMKCVIITSMNFLYFSMEIPWIRCKKYSKLNSVCYMPHICIF